MSDQARIITFAEDINNAEAPSPVPEGTYSAEIREVLQGEGSSGSYANPVFYISPDQYPPDYMLDGDPDGTNVRGYVSLADNKKSRYNLKNFCNAIGTTVSNQVDLDDWIGRECQIVIVHKMYEDLPQANVKKVLPAE